MLILPLASHSEPLRFDFRTTPRAAQHTEAFLGAGWLCGLFWTKPPSPFHPAKLDSRISTPHARGFSSSRKGGSSQLGIGGHVV